MFAALELHKPRQLSCLFDAVDSDHGRVGDVWMSQQNGLELRWRDWRK
jgi:hypothetical protein